MREKVFNVIREVIRLSIICILAYYLVCSVYDVFWYVYPKNVTADVRIVAKICVFLWALFMGFLIVCLTERWYSFMSRRVKHLWDWFNYNKYEEH